jgi:hypothetical protein
MFNQKGNTLVALIIYGVIFAVIVVLGWEALQWAIEWFQAHVRII